MASALASLTANYTDSEGEEDQEDGGRGLHPSLAELNRMVQTSAELLFKPVVKALGIPTRLG